MAPIVFDSQRKGNGIRSLNNPCLFEYRRVIIKFFLTKSRLNITDEI